MSVVELIAVGLIFLGASCLCLAIAGIVEAMELRGRLAALERKESRRKTAERLQKIRDRRKR